MKKTISIFILSSLMLIGLFAQKPMGEGHGQKQPYYQFMVYRMTEVLELTNEQAEKLFPLNRPYRESKQALHMRMNEISEEVFLKENITKVDLNFYKKEIKRLHEEEQKLDEQFFNEAETFLAPDQVAKLMFFEPHFRRELSHELKMRYQQDSPGGKKKKKFNKQK